MLNGTNRTYTRRQFNVLSVSMLGGASLALSGCGGLFGGSSMGDDPGSFDLSMVNGQTTLPAGLDPANLQAVGTGSFGAVTSSAFSVEMQAAIPSLATIWDSASQRVVLLAILDPDSSSNRIDAASTATALIFLGLGGMSLNKDDRRGLIRRIEGSAQQTALTTELGNALAADPYAVTQAPQSLKDAIKGAVDGLSTGAAGLSAFGARSFLQTRDAGFPPLVQIEPTTEVDGLTFVQASDTAGFQVQNTRRRFGRVFTYVTGHVDANNGETAETPPLLTGDPLDIPLTVGLLNTSGQGWAQVTSAVAPLKIVGADKKTKYEMIALTPVFGAAEAPIYSDPRYAAEVPKWKDECGTLRQSVVLAGIMEIVLEILGLGGSTMGYATVQGAIAGLLTTSQVIRNSMTAAYLGNVFYSQVIREYATEMSFEEIFLAELPLLETLTIKIKGDIAANTVRNAFLRPRLIAARAALVALVALGLIELADIIAIAKDTLTGNEANKWSGLIFQPTIALTSTSETYVAGGQVGFTAQVPPTKAPLVYRWKASGSNLIVLDDGITFDKLDFESQKNQVTLSTTPSTVGDLRVDVEVFDATDGGRVSLGTATKSLLKTDNAEVGWSADYVQIRRTMTDGSIWALYYLFYFVNTDESGKTDLVVTYSNGQQQTFAASGFKNVNGTTDVTQSTINDQGGWEFPQPTAIYGNTSFIRYHPGVGALAGFLYGFKGSNEADLAARIAFRQQLMDDKLAEFRSKTKFEFRPV